MYKIGRRHPQARADCIDALTATLECFDELGSDLNGFIVGYLVDLEAVEAAPLMERAFAAGRVDVSIMGDWADVQTKLRLLEPDASSERSVDDFDKQEAQRHLKNIGRNDPCWCGSGKKYKYCHMREEQRVVRG